MSLKKCENLVSLTGTVESLTKKMQGPTGVYFFLVLQTETEILSPVGEIKKKSDSHEILFEGSVADLLFPEVSKGTLMTITGKRIIKKKEGEDGSPVFSTRIIADRFRIEENPCEHVNSILLTGSVTNTPVQGKSKNGNAYLFFNLETISKISKDKEKRTVHSIRLWGKAALTNAKKIGKGEILKIVGILKTQTKKSKKGHPIYCSDIITNGLLVEPQPTF